MKEEDGKNEQGKLPNCISDQTGRERKKHCAGGGHDAALMKCNFPLRGRLVRQKWETLTSAMISHCLSCWKFAGFTSKDEEDRKNCTLRCEDDIPSVSFDSVPFALTVIN